MVNGIPGKNVREVKLKGRPLEPTKRLPWPRMADDGKTPLGVDVAVKRQDIIKIVHKYFLVPGIPMDELMQEVFLAVVHKNHGRSAHDLRKSSFGHYIYMVADNVCINLVHRKKRLEAEKESLDATNGPDDKRTLLETVEGPRPDPDSFEERMEELEAVMRRRGMWDLARYVRATRSGARPEVIREALTWGDRRMTTKSIRDYRAQLAGAIRTLLPEAGMSVAVTD